MTRQVAAPFLPSSADVRTTDGVPAARRVTSDVAARLVFALAKANTKAATLPSAAGVGDWGRVLQLASDENALIVLRNALRSADRRVVPSEVERQLAILSLDREFRMRLLRNRLEQLLVVLNRAKIEVLLLKGGALAATVYDSFVARPMRDIDLLVRPEHADRARALMLTLDWCADPELPGDRSYSTHHHFPPLRDLAASGLRLEIHRSLLPAGHPFRFTDDEVWGGARPIRVGMGRALAMHPAHHAVHIAIHFAWSHMMKLGGWNAFRDLDTLDGAGMLDSSDFTRTAMRWGAASCCYWTLRLARELSAFPVRQSVLHELRPRLPEIVRRSLSRHFANGATQTGPGCPSARLDQALWSLAMQPHRDGHGDVRPWLVSLDLLFALNEKARHTEAALSESPFLQMRRSSRYISTILA